MDPLSISVSAIALFTACAQTIHVIKTTIETVKSAKKELLNILNETNKMRLLLEQLRGLTHQLGSKNNSILLAFDKTGCEEILGELKGLMDKLAQADKFVGFQFLVRRSKLDSLVAGLRAQEDGIRTVLLSVAAESAVFTREYLLTFIDAANVHAVSLSSVTQNAASAVEESLPPYKEAAELPAPPKESKIASESTTASLASPREGSNPEHGQAYETQTAATEDMISLAEVDQPPATSTDDGTEVRTGADPRLLQEQGDSTVWIPTLPHRPAASRIQTAEASKISQLTRIISKAAIWHGQLSRRFYDDEYLNMRDSLADAAYFGDWHDVEATIEHAHRLGLRTVPNCYRLGNPNATSGWTPLHQAAFFCAPESAIRMLVKRGASRTLSTMWTNSRELPYTNMTALEIAEFLGFAHLNEALSPVIRHSIPHATLNQLQQHFHRLIRSDLATRAENVTLRLPELDSLTELENLEMFFPISSPRIAMGYFYRLDGRELLVINLGISSHGQPTYFRITERGVKEIQDGVLFEM